ncbi:MAG TPA: 1,2-phenylacetyl-CoA epoxidase subunit PaaC, partial [Bacteroidia bacterium]|nr:1,2-phenylacetyl-CoA epoxidase subunit PaaC [Bacteroidia bacterium]
FTAFNYHLQNAMLSSTNEKLRSIAEKAIKESTYHLRHCSDWVIRLGDGTEESHKRIQEAVNNLWMFTDDMFEVLEEDKILIGEKIVPDMALIHKQWDATVKQVLDEATIKVPERSYMMKSGRKGIHTEHLGFLLAELQFMQRAYPGAKW